MRYVRIFLLHFQDVFHSRGRSFVWFLVSLINPLLLLLYWQGVVREQGAINPHWTSSTITSYYLLMTIASSFLVVHIEEDVAFRDIKEGSLAKYLLRPFSYFIHKFMEELPWRIIQGFFGFIILFVCIFVFHISLPLVHTPLDIFLTFLVILFALIMSYTYKMIMGLMALWTTDFWGILSLEEIVMLIFGGIALPLTLYPQVLANISYILPLAYITYFPVIAIQGLLTGLEMIKVIGIQILFILLLASLYNVIWMKGIKKFTAVGQ